jgi:hypothetical protein
VRRVGIRPSSVAAFRVIKPLPTERIDKNVEILVLAHLVRIPSAGSMLDFALLRLPIAVRPTMPRWPP